MTQDNRTWILMSRHLSGEASLEEIKELQQLLEQDSRKQYAYDILHSYFDRQSGPELPVDDTGLDENLQKIISFPAPRPSARGRIKWMAAATVAACLLLGWGIYHRNAGAAPSLPAGVARGEEVLAKAGARTKLSLPDGTRVWLNSNSKLNFSRDFNVNDRDVTLEGEAYFEVAKDARLPFIVHANSLDITVLGTSFAVKSYPQDETIEATLLDGSIEVSRKGNPGATRIILKPNEKLVYSKYVTTHNPADPPSVPAHTAPAPPPDVALTVNPIRQDIPDSDKVETAWLYNRLVFDGDHFRQLADKMERWYNVRIRIRDSRLNDYRFSGIFEKETLDEALKELQLTRGFIYKTNGNEIDLYAKRE
jgi:ferric-dicitrate binding protein FerR (iron transport regulator)